MPVLLNVKHGFEDVKEIMGIRDARLCPCKVKQNTFRSFLYSSKVCRTDFAASCRHHSAAESRDDPRRTAKLPVLRIFNSEATKIITRSLLYAVEQHWVVHLSSNLSHRTSRLVVETHGLFNDALFYAGGPIVIDVARLRVIR